MSEQTNSPPLVPEWDVADRMKKALRVADIGVQEMADYLGVARNTVSTWINGRITPSKQTLRLWALRCGVPFEWLDSGRDARVTSAQMRPGLSLITDRVRTAGWGQGVWATVTPFGALRHTLAAVS